MKKSILVLAAVAATGVMAQISAVEARGLRIGFGFGLPFAGRLSHIADPTILERAQRTQQNQAVQYDRRRAAAAALAAAAAERRQAAAALAKARAEKAEAQRQARLATQAAAAAKIKAGAPAVIAAPAVVAPAVVPASLPADEKALLAAQEEQRAKADRLLKSLTAKPANEPGRQAGADIAPFDTGAPVAPAPAKIAAPAVPVSVPVVAPVSAPAQVPAAKSAFPAGDCKRFIPNAGVTISVPCTE